METIKEEKKADLEQLLNSLIKAWWKPRGHKANRVQGKRNYVCIDFDWVWEDEYLDELVRKSSWLWQFVCENGMVKENDDVRIKNYQWDNECDTNCCYDDYEYRLIESALKDESELEQFLLQNIKIWNED